MSAIAKRIDELIRADLAGRLRDAGYRKSGRTFHRAAPDHTRVVNVQADRWNEGGSGRICVNLGVFLPAVAALSDAPVPQGGFPKEYECTVRERLGALAYGGHDHWWTIDATTEPAGLARSLGAAWSVFGRPWLERASTLEGAYEIFATQQIHFAAAHVALALGWRDDARALCERAIAAAPRARARFESWAQRHGLLAPDPTR